MKTAATLKGLKDAHEAYDAARRELIGVSAKAQHAAKRAMFALQRDDEAGAKALLSEADGHLERALALATGERLRQEGSYRAALEEYAEARQFLQLELKGEVAPLDGLDEETQIAGLCDALGEVVRMMTVRATQGRRKDVERLKASADAVWAGLVEMDFGGYLRTKADQARGHLRRAEEIMYDLSLHGRER